MLDADLLADRRLLAEELVHHRLAQDAHLGGGRVLLAPEHLACGQRPAAHLQVRRGSADHLREPVRAAVHHLGAGAVHGRERGDAGGELLLDRLRVVAGEVLRGSAAGRRAVLRDGAGHDHEQVRPERGHLRRHFRLRALADGDRGDHGGDGDDDSERGEERAQFVLP